MRGTFRLVLSTNAQSAEHEEEANTQRCAFDSNITCHLLHYWMQLLGLLSTTIIPLLQADHLQRRVRQVQVLAKVVVRHSVAAFVAPVVGPCAPARYAVV